MEKEHIDLLVFRFLNKTATEPETSELLAWVQAMPENKQYFQALSRQYQALSNPAAGINIEQAWQETQAKTVAAAKPAAQLPRPKSGGFKMSTLIFAAAAASVLAFVAYLVFNKSPEPAIIAETYQSGATIKDIRLKDSTLCTLDEQSTLSLSSENGQRFLEAAGTAYIQIPASGADVTVRTPLGDCTLSPGSYQIECAGAGKPVKITAIAGKAQLAAANGRPSIELKPGEALACASGLQPQKSTQENANYLAWKTGVLEFNNTPLSKALPEIGGFYKKTIIAETPGLQNCLLNAKLDRYSFDEVKTMLELAFQARFRTAADTVYVTGQGCGPM